MGFYDLRLYQVSKRRIHGTNERFNLRKLFSMAVARTPIVIPVRAEFLALFVVIGVFGFGAQVSSLSLHVTSQLTLRQTLLTMGLQRVSAARGTLAIYTQVSANLLHSGTSI